MRCFKILKDSKSKELYRDSFMTLSVIMQDFTKGLEHVSGMNLKGKDELTLKGPFLRNQGLLRIQSDNMHKNIIWLPMSYK